MNERYAKRAPTDKSTEKNQRIMDDVSECCCVCLDSLSSAPVVCLLKSSHSKVRICRHFIHSRCAKRLRPRKCPLCRQNFGTLSAEMSKDDFSKYSMQEIMRGLCEMDDEKQVKSVRTDTLLELLAAVCPVNKVDLERASEKRERLTEDQVLNLLKMCDIIPRCDEKKNRSVLVTIRRFKSYDTKTILRRFFRSALLRLAGAVGTSICSSLFGGAAGVSLGALVSIPPESVLEIDISGRAYVVFYDHSYH